MHENMQKARDRLANTMERSQKSALNTMRLADQLHKLEEDEKSFVSTQTWALRAVLLTQT